MDSDLGDALIEASLQGGFGRPFRYLASTDSTNEQALRWLAAGAPEGALVVADHQTAGRGRRGRAWVARPGEALLFSLVLHPRGQSQVVELLTTALGVACSRGIEAACGLDVGLKWPNDVMVGDRKLAGILVESRVGGGAIDGAVAGIGINVYGPPESDEVDFSNPASSIATELSSRQGGAGVPSRAVLLAEVVSAFEALYSRLATPDGRDEVRAEATRRSSVLGRVVSVRLGDGSTVEGRAVELTSSGALALARDDGATVVLGAGEIERLRSV